MMTDRIRLTKKMAAEIQRYRENRDQFHRLVYGNAATPTDAVRSVPRVIEDALNHLNDALEDELSDIRNKRVQAGKLSHVCYECGTGAHENQLMEVCTGEVSGSNLYCPVCYPAVRARYG